MNRLNFTPAVNGTGYSLLTAKGCEFLLVWVRGFSSLLRSNKKGMSDLHCAEWKYRGLAKTKRLYLPALLLRVESRLVTVIIWISTLHRAIQICWQRDFQTRCIVRKIGVKLDDQQNMLIKIGESPSNVTGSKIKVREFSYTFGTCSCNIANSNPL